MLEQDDYNPIQISENEVRIERTRGTGAGGQHKNSTDSCIVMTHLSTGIKVVRDGRNQHENKDLAFKEITRRVNEYYRTGQMLEQADERKEQVGSGTRSDKRRTYRVKDGIVVDHITNKTANLKDILRGKIELLS